MIVPGGRVDEIGRAGDGVGDVDRTAAAIQNRAVGGTGRGPAAIVIVNAVGNAVGRVAGEYGIADGYRILFVINTATCYGSGIIDDCIIPNSRAGPEVMDSPAAP